MDPILEIISDRVLTYHQKLFKLAMEAENSVAVLNYNATAKQLLKQGIICEMFEGNAPYRPRYTLPDYGKFLKEGSPFLDIKPAADLHEAIFNLLIIYRHIPSITSFPVYLGQLDELFNPYLTAMPDGCIEKLLRQFLLHIDRTLTDSFVHANIGPNDSKAARLLLKFEAELKNAVPNLSLKINQDTPDELILAAIRTCCSAAKPHFVNDTLCSQDYRTGYGVVSCYNTLPLGGGSYTLVRMNLKKLAEKAGTQEVFFATAMPEAVAATAAVIEGRIQFLVEESNFFESSFLVNEGLLHTDRFTAMFGLVGVAECVNTLLPGKCFGKDPDADELGLKILESISKEVAKFKSNYCAISNNRFLLHAQAGIVGDTDVSPGARIPTGDEPGLINHIRHAAPYHQFFPTGVSDIFVFEPTVRSNPEYLLDIIKGAMQAGLKIFSFYCSDSELIRITGFLVKRAEIAKYQAGKATLHDTVPLGLDAVRNKSILNRAVRK